MNKETTEKLEAFDKMFKTLIMVFLTMKLKVLG